MDRQISLVDVCLLANNEDAADQYLEQLNIGAIPHCNDCNHQMSLRKDKRKIYRCSRCHKSKSFYLETIFHNCKIGRGQVLLLGYLWVNEVPFSKIVQMTNHSDMTVRYWTKVFSQAVTYSIEANGEENKIGGDEIIVEIDESKFGKRKYNRGHRVEGVWVVGGRERTPTKRMFAVKVEDRSAETLLSIIQKYVHPGSIIYTDCWKGYKTEGLLDLQMLHQTVNHTYNFVDPVTGVHTNSIEGTWGAMKVCIPKRKRTENDIEPHLFEYMWRRNNVTDLWASFIVALKDIYDNIEAVEDEL